MLKVQMAFPAERTRSSREYGKTVSSNVNYEHHALVRVSRANCAWILRTVERRMVERTRRVKRRSSPWNLRSREGETKTEIHREILGENSIAPSYRLGAPCTAGPRNDYLTFERGTTAVGERLGKWFNKINTMGTNPAAPPSRTSREGG